MWRLECWESGRESYRERQKRSQYRKNKRNIWQQKYLFIQCGLNTIFDETASLYFYKSTHSNDVPTKIGKPNTDLFAVYLSGAYISGTFLSVFTHIDITWIHKKKLRLDKSNHRPVSLLPNISKIFGVSIGRSLTTSKQSFQNSEKSFRKEYST